MVTSYDPIVLMSSIPDDAKLHVEIWRPRMEMLAQAGRGFTSIIKQHAGEWGAKPGTITRLYYAYQDHGIAGLLDKRSCGKFLEGGVSRGLPPQFIEHWRGMVERAQRGQTMRHMHRILLDHLTQWRRGSKAHAIPGYDTPPRNQPGKNHPPGWSYDRLVQHMKGQRAELVLARQGRQALKQYLPKIYTSRVGLAPGQLIIPDDSWWDIDVAWNNGQVARPLAIDLIDVASACELLDGVMGRHVRGDGTKAHIKTEYTLWLLLAHFEREGYRADVGTHVLMEAGTATVDSAIRDAFARFTDSKIIMQAGKTDRRPLKDLYFDGPAKGNPRFKTVREGANHLLRTYASLLLAPVGRNRDEAPEEHPAIVSYVQKLMKAVPEHRRHLLKLPMLTEEQFHEIRMDLKAAVNNRTWHELEGWEECRYMRQEFQLPGWPGDHWQPFAMLQEILGELPPEKAQALSLALTTHRPPLIRPRRMSPAEVWDAHKHKLTRLPVWKRNLILPASMAFAARVREDRQIIIKHEGEMWRFDALCTTTRGDELQLRPGRDVLMFINPLDPQTALVTDVHNAALGISAQLITPTRLDHEGFLKRAAHRNTIAADIEHRVARRAGAIAAERAEMVQHNERVVKGLPVTDEEKATTRAAASVIDAETVTPATPSQQARTDAAALVEDLLNQ